MAINRRGGRNDGMVGKMNGGGVVEGYTERRMNDKFRGSTLIHTTCTCMHIMKGIKLKVCKLCA